MPAATPLVSVVISTHARPVEVRDTIAAVRAQDHDGPIETIVVYDKATPDETLESDDPHRPVRVATNTRGSGLAGSRNTGAGLARARYVGFCDDDDMWLPNRVARQLRLIEATGAKAVAGEIRIGVDGGSIDRGSGVDSLTHHDLIRSRVPEAYMGTVLVDREHFFDRVGPVDEDLPLSFAEDYEWWLRATRLGPMPVLREPVLEIRWGGNSHFRHKWKEMADALEYVVERHPEFADDRRGMARINGQRAFARAAHGARREAVGLAARSIGEWPAEPRAWLALGVAAHLMSAERVMSILNKRGRGI